MRVRVCARVHVRSCACVSVCACLYKLYPSFLVHWPEWTRHFCYLFSSRHNLHRARECVCVRTFIKIPGSVKIFYDYFIINTEEISKPEAIIEIDLLIYRIIIFIVARLNELLSRLPCLWRGVWKTNLFIPPSFTSPDKVCWICEVCFLVMVSLEPSALKLSTNYHR